jgi:hypothetical protein
MLFKTVSVFDRAQVDPIDGREQAPLAPPCEPLTGDSHAHLLAPIRVFAESLGFSVSFESIPGETGGWCDQNARRIVVDAAAPANAQLRILIHETVHALGVGYAQYGRQRAEVIVDTVIFSSCQASTAVVVDGGLGDRCFRRVAEACLMPPVVHRGPVSSWTLATIGCWLAVMRWSCCRSGVCPRRLV